MRVEWRATRFVACALLFFCNAAGHGAIVDWLYEVEVPVADQSAAERARGAREALQLLITRLSGEKSPAQHDAIAKALAAPERYLVGYEYRADPKKQPPVVLGVKFSPTATRSLVESAALPMWSRSRPSVLAWVAMDANGERRVLGSGDGHPLAEALLERARQLGIAIALPIMDPEAEPEVATEAVWNRRWDAIESASLRYDAQSLLVGRITLSSTGRWLADWTYRPVPPQESRDPLREGAQGDGGGEGERRGSVDAEEPGIAAAAGIEVVVDALVDRYAVASGPLVDLPVEVQNADGIASYGGLLDYLATLDYVEDVLVDQVRRDGIGLRLRTRVQRPQLHDLFAIDGRLVPIADASAIPRAFDVDRLAWRPPSS